MSTDKASVKGAPQNFMDIAGTDLESVKTEDLETEFRKSLINPAILAGSPE